MHFHRTTTCLSALAAVLCLLWLATTGALAAVPAGLNYQAIARDLSGAPLSSKNIKVRTTIRRSALAGTIVYQEVHSATTSPGGQFALVIGSGTPEVGSFTAIAWSIYSHFLQIGIDPTNGSSFTDMGTQQLLSVPYSLHAGSSDSTAAVSGTSGSLAYFASSSAVRSTSLYYNGYLGIYEPNPSYYLDCAGTIRSQTNLRADNDVIAQGDVTATGGISAASAAITNNLAAGTVTVQSGRGIVRSNSATQQKIVRTSVNFGFTLSSNSSIDSGLLTYEAFGGVPTVTMGACTVAGGEWYKLIIMPFNVTTTSCQFRIFNAASDSVIVPSGTTWQVTVIGPQ